MSTCRPRRRLISSASFLRHYRSLHAPPVLGHFYASRGTSFVPAPPPLGPRETTVDVIRDNVSLGFLARGGYDKRDMMLTDSCGGLLAFVRFSTSSMVICDPLARQYTEVNLPATTPQASEPCCIGAFLLDADARDTVIPSLSVSNFSVLCVRVVSEEEHFSRRLTARAIVFSTRDSQWLLLSTTVVQPSTYHSFVGRTEGCLVWSGVGTKVLLLDESTGELSYFTLPPAAGTKDVNLRAVGTRNDTFYYWRRNFRAVGRDDTGAVRLARIVGGGNDDLEVLRCVPGGGVGAVTVERAVNLSHLTGITPAPWSNWYFLEIDDAAVPAGSVVVSTTANDTCKWMFTVDVETMEADRGRKRDWDPQAVLPYELPWPPPIK